MNKTLERWSVEARERGGEAAFPRRRPFGGGARTVLSAATAPWAAHLEHARGSENLHAAADKTVRAPLQRSNAPTLQRSNAFTLIELLAVLLIMGIIAAVALPSLQSLKPNPAAAATRQLLDAVTYARQLAMSRRATVYMIFVPPNFWKDQAVQSWTQDDWTNASTLYDKQMAGYTYVSLRSVGDQPGVSYPQYLTPWRTLPQGAYISYEKFNLQGNGLVPLSGTKPALVLNVVTNGINAYQVVAFNTTNSIPFPTETNRAATYVTLPYIAFDAAGSLVSGTSFAQPEFIPITQGSVGIARDPTTRAALQSAPSPRDVPSGNTTNNFNLVYIDPLTGRSRIEHQKVQ